MAFNLIQNFDDEDNFEFDIGKIQLIGGIAKLIPIVSAPDVVMYVKLDENKGLVAIDCCGNDNHGAFQGGYTEAQWATGKINYGIQGISTTSGFINFDQLISFERTDPFSLECWFKTTSSSTMSLMSKQSDSGVFQGFAINFASNTARLVIRDSLSNIIAKQHNVTLNDAVWHHVVLTYDGNSGPAGAKLYVDNVENNTTTNNDTLTGSLLTTADFQISGRDGNNICIDSTTFIDECLVYDRELSAAEIAFRWNLGNGTQTVPGATTSFPTDNPTIKSSNSFFMSELADFDATIVEPGSDEVRFVMVVNNVDKWWNGSAWANSSSYSESNTVAEISTNALSLLTDLQPLAAKAFLHSDDGSTTPELDDVTVDFNSEGASADAPNECLVTGTVFTNQGSPAEGTNITAQLIMPFQYDSESVITQNLFTTVADSNGDWSISLVENENMEAGAGYKFTFSGPGINYSRRKIVPDEITKNFSELVDL